MTTGIESSILSPNYLLLILREWKIVVTASMICTFLSAAVYLTGPKSYESSSMLMLYPPYFKISGTDQARRITSPDQNPILPAEDLSELMPQMLPIETYKRIAESPDVFQEIINTLDLDDTELEDLQDKCRLELTPLGSRSPTFGTQYSQTMLFTATGSTPELAAEIAQTWVEIFKARVDQLNQTGLDETHALVQSMWDSTKTDLEKAENTLRDFQSEWDVQLLELQREAKLEKLTMLETELVQIEIDLAAQEAIVESLRADLKNEQKIDVLFRAPSDDVYWLSKGAASTSDGEIDSSSGLRTEEINPVYTVARDMEIAEASKLAGLEKKKSFSESKIEQMVQEIDELYETIVTQRTEEKRLMRAVETMEQTFELAASSLEKSKIAGVNKASDLQIVANAVVPNRSTRTSPLISGFMATLLGALLGISYVVVREVSLQMTKDPASDESASAASDQ